MKTCELCGVGVNREISKFRIIIPSRGSSGILKKSRELELCEFCKYFYLQTTLNRMVPEVQVNG